MEANILALQNNWPIKLARRNYLRYHCVPLNLSSSRRAATTHKYFRVTNAQLDAKHATVGSKIHQTTGQIFLFWRFHPLTWGFVFFVFEKLPRTKRQKMASYCGFKCGHSGRIFISTGQWFPPCGFFLSKYFYNFPHFSRGRKKSCLFAAPTNIILDML